MDTEMAIKSVHINKVSVLHVLSQQVEFGENV